MRPPIAGTEGDVAAHVEMREERVLLEYEPDPPPLRGKSIPRVVSSQVSGAERDDPVIRPKQAGDGPEHARLARAGRADERDGLGTELECYREPEGAKSVIEVESERVHVRTTLTAKRIRALATTSSAPIASALSKLTSNSWYTASESVWVTPWSDPANMMVAPNSPRPAGEREREPGAEAARRERQRDPPERPCRPGTERPRR